MMACTKGIRAPRREITAMPTRYPERWACVLFFAAALCSAAAGPGEQPTDSTALVERLRSDDPEVRVEAAQEAAQTAALVGDEGLIDAMTTAMGDPVEEVRFYAVTAVAAAAYTVEDAESAGLLRASSALIERLGDTSMEVQEAAAQALALLGTPPEATVDLLNLLESSAPAVRRVAVEALGALPSPNAAVGEALIERLRKDPEEAVRGQAARALAAHGLIDEQVVEALRQALADPAEHVRLMVINALASMGPYAAAAVPDLEQLASADESETVRQAAKSALRSIRGG